MPAGAFINGIYWYDHDNNKVTRGKGGADVALC